MNINEFYEDRIRLFRLMNPFKGLKLVCKFTNLNFTIKKIIHNIAYFPKHYAFSMIFHLAILSLLELAHFRIICRRAWSVNR